MSHFVPKVTSLTTRLARRDGPEECSAASRVQPCVSLVRQVERMHDVYTARLFCWQPTSGILTGGIVVGQDVAIRVAEFHTLGHRPDKYIPRNNLQPGEFLYIIDRPLQRPLVHHPSPPGRCPFSPSQAKSETPTAPP